MTYCIGRLERGVHRLSGMQAPHNLDLVRTKSFALSPSGRLKTTSRLLALVAVAIFASCGEEVTGNEPSAVDDVSRALGKVFLRKFKHESRLMDRDLNDVGCVRAGTVVQQISAYLAKGEDGKPRRRPDGVPFGVVEEVRFREDHVCGSFTARAGSTYVTSQANTIKWPPEADIPNQPRWENVRISGIDAGHSSNGRSFSIIPNTGFRLSLSSAEPPPRTATATVTVDLRIPGGTYLRRATFEAPYSLALTGSTEAEVDTRITGGFTLGSRATHRAPNFNIRKLRHERNFETQYRSAHCGPSDGVVLPMQAQITLKIPRGTSGVEASTVLFSALDIDVDVVPCSGE